MAIGSNTEWSFLIGTDIPKALPSASLVSTETTPLEEKTDGYVRTKVKSYVLHMVLPSDYQKSEKMTTSSTLKAVPIRPQRKCDTCGEQETPLWRPGPLEYPNLCNACGLVFSRYRRANPDGKWEPMRKVRIKKRRADSALTKTPSPMLRVSEKQGDKSAKMTIAFLLNPMVDRFT